jgi:hypothetical protein
VHGLLRVQTPTESKEFDQPLAVHGRLASGEPEIPATSWEKSNDLERLVHQVAVVSRLRRLGAHQAEVVTAFRKQEAVLVTVVTPLHVNAPAIVSDGNNVARGDVGKGVRELDKVDI